MWNIFKFIGTIAVVVAMVIFVRTCGVPVVDLRNDEPAVTLMKFNQIDTGMTYKQIVEIIGEEGIISSDSSIDDDQGGHTKTTVYEWKFGDSTGMRITIQNGKLFKKTQFKLE